MKNVFILFAITLLVSCGGGSGGGSSDDNSNNSGNSNPPNPTPSNTPVAGTVSVSGDTDLGDQLESSNTLSDADGLGTFNYQWLRGSSEISGATSANYTITQADLGQNLSVRISFTDDAGNAESAASSGLSIPSGNSGGGNGNTPPNILLLISDDQGVDSSAQYSYSSDVPTTPRLNQLAQQGVVFDNAWATPACTTTRATLISGLHGVNSGVTFVPGVLSDTVETVQSRLSANPNTSEYASAVFGKWHLAGGRDPSPTHPQDVGVDYFSGLLAGTVSDYSNWEHTVNGTTSTSTTYHTTAITDFALDWIEDQNQPWFVWMGYVAPHSPFHLPPANLHSRTGLTGEQADIDANTREYYLAAIEALDTEIGRLIDNMPAEDRENLIVIYIGDNGTPNGVRDATVYMRGHSKGSLFEGGVRVPLMVSGSAVGRQNVRESALVNSSDIFATVLDLAGAEPEIPLGDSYSFKALLDEAGESVREYNYTEFESDTETGWAVRNEDYKLIEYSDGSQSLFSLADLSEQTDLISDASLSSIVTNLRNFALSVRGEIVDITNVEFISRSGNCRDAIAQYESTVLDVNRDIEFNGDLRISADTDTCSFQTNGIPNHDFNDGERSFPNDVSDQDSLFTIPASPSFASENTQLSLDRDNAVMLNGVAVDLLAAACFGVGDERTGCNNVNQPWRFDPMHAANGFRIDTHNAHSQGNGKYHYHGDPKALYNQDGGMESPLIGFAADGFPIYGPFIEDADGVTIRRAVSSYQLRAGARPNGASDPGGNYDGTFRDDYEYVAESGDLDECNGMTYKGQYAYFLTEGFPYIVGCFKGTPDSSFLK